MSNVKNLNYEANVLQAFADNYLIDGNCKFTLGLRRNPREDGTFKDNNTGQIFSAELTKITNENIEKRNSFLLEERGVGEPFTAYAAREAIVTIEKKNKKYTDHTNRILILGAFSCAPFDWKDHWQAAIEYGQQTEFAAIYAVQTEKNKLEILSIKNQVI